MHFETPWVTCKIKYSKTRVMDGKQDRSMFMAYCCPTCRVPHSYDGSRPLPVVELPKKVPDSTRCIGYAAGPLISLIDAPMASWLTQHCEGVYFGEVMYHGEPTRWRSLWFRELDAVIGAVGSSPSKSRPGEYSPWAYRSCSTCKRRYSTSDSNVLMRPLGLLRAPKSPDEVIGQEVSEFIMATPIGTRFAAEFPKDIDCEEVNVLTELPEPIPQWDNAR